MRLAETRAGCRARAPHALGPPATLPGRSGAGRLRRGLASNTDSPIEFALDPGEEGVIEAKPLLGSGSSPLSNSDLLAIGGEGPVLAASLRSWSTSAVSRRK